MPSQQLTTRWPLFWITHIHQGNELRIDARKTTWKRVVDLNDRALRQVVIGLGGPMQGVPREDGFDIYGGIRNYGYFLLSVRFTRLKAIT